MINKQILKTIAPSASDAILSDLEKYFDKYLQKYQINTWLRVCHFIAQAAHESAGFKTLEEYASGSAYEGRKDLGNTQPGDGKLFKGRGIFQLTGRANYKDMSGKLGIDLISNPNLAKTGEVSVLTACEYWNSRNLSKYADQDDVLTITKKINGGTNGLDDRKLYLERAKKTISKSLFGEISIKKGDKGDSVKELQNLLVKKGYSIVPDGDFGKLTELAVVSFQKQNALPETGIADSKTLEKLKV